MYSQDSTAPNCITAVYAAYNGNYTRYGCNSTPYTEPFLVYSDSPSVSTTDVTITTSVTSYTTLPSNSTLTSLNGTASSTSFSNNGIFSPTLTPFSQSQQAGSTVGGNGISSMASSTSTAHSIEICVGRLAVVPLMSSVMLVLF